MAQGGFIRICTWISGIRNDQDRWTLLLLLLTITISNRMYLKLRRLCQVRYLDINDHDRWTMSLIIINSHIIGQMYWFRYIHIPKSTKLGRHRSDMSHVLILRTDIFQLVTFCNTVYVGIEPCRYNWRNFLHYHIPPPILGTFYNNEKNYFAYWYWTNYFSIISKLNHLYNVEKILYAIKCIWNGGIMSLTWLF